MNDNFDFNPNEIVMTEEEKKAHRSTFSKLCLSFVAYLAIVEVLVVVAGIILKAYFPELLSDYNASIVISSVIQYAIAFPPFVMLIRKIPAHPPQKNTLSANRIWKYAAVSMFFMYVGNYISTMIMTYMELGMGNVPENSVDTLLTNTNVLLSIAIVGIIGPIIEELMFRKLFIDRLTPYGEAVAILFPSLMFGLFHGNLYQFFYAFLLGVAFSYVYIKSGKIIYSTVFHIFINLFCGVFPSVIMGMLDLDELMKLAAEGAITDEYIEANLLPLTLFGIYEVVFFALVFAGIFMFSRNLKNIKLNKGEVKLPKGEGGAIMFFNVGAVVLITYCIVTIALNTFAV